jgi:DNA-binding transcriptional LysR family regulator
MFKGKEYIYEVYKEQSFSKAAQNLYISQPALSSFIKKIEKRLGCCLFDRSSNPITLTEAGKEYLRSAEKIMDIENRFENYLSHMNQLKTGRLSLGASNGFASFILPGIITRFTDKYPCIKVNLVEANSPQLESRLFAGEFDFVFDNNPRNELIYDEHFFCQEHLLLSVPKKFLSNQKVTAYQLSLDDVKHDRHIDASTQAVPLSTFAQDPCILLREGNDTRIRADKIFSENNIKPQIVLELDQLATAYNIACSGMGFTLISDTLARKTNLLSDMFFYKLDSIHTIRNISFYNKKNKYLTKAMEEFIATTQTFPLDS